MIRFRTARTSEMTFSLWAAIGMLGLFAMVPWRTGAGREVADSSKSDVERNAALARRYFEEVWNRGNVDALDELLAPNYVNHTPSTPNPPPGPQGLKPIVRAIRQAFPDLHYEIKDVIATPDSVAIRVVMTGTHRGDLFGVAPTGRTIKVDQVNIEHIERGRIVEHWRVTDELSLMRQIGVVK